MQKALTEMNVQLANVISDLSGATGMAILRAIVAGERDPERLARLKNERIQARHAEIARSLEGTWREELRFALAQSLELYDTYGEKLTSCDQRIEAHLKTMTAQVDVETEPIPAPRRRRFLALVALYGVRGSGGSEPAASSSASTGASELVILNPAHHPIESLVRFFLWMPGVPGCITLQKTRAPSSHLTLNRGGKAMVGFESRTRPVSKNLPVNVAVHRLAQHSGACPSAGLD